jgi:hypothetical protein
VKLAIIPSRTIILRQNVVLPLWEALEDCDILWPLNDHLTITMEVWVHAIPENSSVRFHCEAPTNIDNNSQFSRDSNISCVFFRQPLFVSPHWPSHLNDVCTFPFGKQFLCHFQEFIPP